MFLKDVQHQVGKLTTSVQDIYCVIRKNMIKCLYPKKLRIDFLMQDSERILHEAFVKLTERLQIQTWIDPGCCFGNGSIFLQAIDKVLAEKSHKLTFWESIIK